MYTRVLVATIFSALLLSGCDEGSKEASVCKGLNEADCTAKTECTWNADKDKCKPKEEGEKTEDKMTPEQSAPPAASEQIPPEPSQQAPAGENQSPAESPDEAPRE